MKIINNILVTTDFSNESDWAVEEAALMAKKFNSTLYMLDVVNVVADSGAEYQMPYRTVESEKRMLMERAHERLMEKVKEMEMRFQIRAIGDVRYGNVHDEILNEELEKQIDLLVIAPHERKGIMGKVFPNLAERVIRDSSCDALVVRKGIPLEEGHIFI